MQKPGARDRVHDIENFINQHGRILLQKDVMTDAWRIGSHYKQFHNEKWFPAVLKYYTGKNARVWVVDVPSISEFKQAVGGPKAKDGFRAQLMGDRVNELKEKFGVLDNGIHASDSAESGKREIKLWFSVPELAKIYEPGKQKDVETIHRKIYSKLNKLVTPLGCSLLFAGGTHNGLAIPENDVDLDYRILCPDNANVVEIGKQVASQFDGLEYKYMGVDPKTQANYVKYEIKFADGKADVAFVPAGPYKNKISAAHLATLMPADWIKQARNKKSVAFAQGSEQYKSAKNQIKKDIDSAFGVQEMKFAEWFHEASLPVTNIKMPYNQPFNDYEKGILIAQNLRQPFEAFLKKALIRGANNKGNVYTNIKSQEAFADKIKRGKEGLKITDLLRGAIVVNGDADDVKNVAKWMYNNADVVSYEEKKHPRSEDRMGYHGSFHIDINFEGLVCEVQIMNLRLWNSKESLHSTYEMQRIGLPIPVSQIIDASRFFKRANKPYDPRPSTPPQLDIED
jgi:nucleoside diphosphate kinase